MILQIAVIIGIILGIASAINKVLFVERVRILRSPLRIRRLGRVNEK